MQSQTHDIANLFAQLGLSDEPMDIDGFITAHGPLPGVMFLDEAPFWNRGQAAFLREGLLDDSDWAGAIDALNERLRQQPR
ncbi:MAG: DUF2789 family protein [Rubrivivax sp.]